MHRILIALVLLNLLGNLLNLLLDFVLIRPVAISPYIMERFKNVRERVHLRNRYAYIRLNRHWLHLSIFIGQRDRHGLLGNNSITIKVNAFNDFLIIVVFIAYLWKLRYEKRQENRELFPIRRSIRQNGRQEIISTHKSLCALFELYFVVIFQSLKQLNASVDDWIKLLPVCVIQIKLDKRIHIIIGIDLHRLHVVNQVIQLIGIRLTGKHRGLIVSLEGFLDIRRIIDEVQHESIRLIRSTTIQSRQCLHCLYIKQLLVHIHGLKQRLVIAGLEFVRYDQNTVWVFSEFFLNLGTWKSVDLCLGISFTLITNFTGECNHRLILTLALLQFLLDGKVIFNRPLDLMSDNHCTSFALDLHPDVVVEMLYNDTSLFLYRMRITFHIRAQDFIRSLFIKKRIITYSFYQVIVALIRCVIFQDIKNKLLLDCLLHCIHIMRLSLFGSVLI